MLTTPKTATGDAPDTTGRQLSDDEMILLMIAEMLAADECRCRLGRICPPCTAKIVKRATSGFRDDLKRILMEHSRGR
jgi:hypothetical protein